MSETDRTRTYRVVILDLRQHPYSPGIVGLDTFEVEKSSVGTGNKTQLKWSDYKNGAHSFHGDCSLGVCCGADVVRIYTRAIHGWWTCTSNVHSQSVLSTSSHPISSSCVNCSYSLLSLCLVGMAPFLRSAGSPLLISQPDLFIKPPVIPYLALQSVIPKGSL